MQSGPLYHTSCSLAVIDFDILRCPHFKPDLPTVTASTVFHLGLHFMLTMCEFASNLGVGIFYAESASHPTGN